MQVTIHVAVRSLRAEQQNINKNVYFIEKYINKVLTYFFFCLDDENDYANWKAGVEYTYIDDVMTCVRVERDVWEPYVCAEKQTPVCEYETGS